MHVPFGAVNKSNIQIFHIKKKAAYLAGTYPACIFVQKYAHPACIFCNSCTEYVCNICMYVMND